MFGLFARTPIPSISPETLYHRLAAQDPPQVIDVREPWEFAQGHIAGALNLPLGTLAATADRISREREAVLICAHGVRSQAAYRLLSGLGFTLLYHVTGGMAQWRGPVVR